MRIIIEEAGVEYRVPSDRKVKTPEDAARISEKIAASATECFCVLSLDSKNGMRTSEVVTMGILDGCLAHAREVFREAIVKRAAAIVLVHNHPSGDPSPSAEDIRITSQLVQAGKVMGIKVLDHVIIAMKPAPDVGIHWYSMREAGLVPFDN